MLNFEITINFRDEKKEQPRKEEGKAEVPKPGTAGNSNEVLWTAQFDSFSKKVLNRNRA